MSTTQATTQTTHWIPLVNSGLLSATIDRLAKKARRLGLPAVQMRRTGREEVRTLTRSRVTNSSPPSSGARKGT